MNSERPVARAEEGLEWLVVVVVVGAGVLLGILAHRWFEIGVGALIVGVVLNLGLLIRVLVRSGNWDRVGIAILGSVPAGIFDAVKIFVVGMASYWLAGLVR